MQRIAKFSRDLKALGWEPHVITAEHVPGRPEDPSLEDDVVGIPVTRLPHHNATYAIARPLGVLKRLMRRGGAGAAPVGVSREGGASATGMPLSTRLVRWLCIPDEARRWARSAVRHVKATGGPFDAVLASGPPYSTLIAGRRCAAALGVPLAIDMRDAWATNPLFLRPTALHRAIGDRQERRVCEAAAIVTAVSPDIAREAAEFGARRVEVVPNGYDADEMPPLASSPDGPLVLGFMGRFYGLTDPTPLLDALQVVAADAEGPGVRFDVVGAASPAVTAAVHDRGLESVVRFHGYLPHGEALSVMAAADVGVVVIADLPGARSVYTGKLFEYLGMGLPVLLVGPTDGAAAELIGTTRAGEVVAYGDVRGIAETVRRMRRAKAAGQPLAAPERERIERFERRKLAASLADLLEDAIGRTTV